MEQRNEAFMLFIEMIVDWKLFRSKLELLLQGCLMMLMGNFD